MMGVIKAKNSAGEWVNVANAEATITNEFVGDLRMETVEYGWGQHKQSLDLSPYVGANDNFIIILELSSSKNDGTTGCYLWHKEDGLDHVLPQRNNSSSTSLTNGIFAEVSGSDVSVSYDETTQTFSLIDDTYKWIYSFTILYAGVKEA